jgi:hypothetical protein
MSQRTLRTRVPVTAVVAAVAHLTFDAVASRLSWTTPPYLLLDHVAGPFRDIVAIDRTSVGIAVAIAASSVNGLITATLAAALDGTERRVRGLGLLLSGLWVLSGGLLALLYLSAPLGILAGSLAAGVPRSFAVAWIAERVRR